jgi:DNA-binding winged helix-turn-helix (wHTH) protein
MTAAAVHDLDTAPSRRGLGQPRAVAPPAPAEGPTSVLVTVQIAVAGESLPPAAAGLFDNLRALASHGLATDVTVTTAPAPGGYPEATPQRPRLVRLADPRELAGPEILVHVASRSVYRDGAAVRLTRREFDLLVFLCEQPRRVFTRVQLLRQVWGYEPVSGERTVDVHVRRLRIKLGGGAAPVVATVRGVGYRLAENARVTLSEIES